MGFTKAVASTATSRSGLVFGLARSLWRYKFIVFTLLSVVFLLWGAVLDSFDEGSLEPFVNSIGETVFSADYNLFLYLRDSPAPVSFWSSLRAIFELFSLLWIIGAFVWFFAFVIAKSPLSNESMWFANYLLAVLFIYFLMSGFCLSFNESLDREESSCFSFYPGVRSLVGLGPDYFVGFNSFLSDFLSRKTESNVLVNDSLNTSVGLNSSFVNGSVGSPSFIGDLGVDNFVLVD